IAAVVGGTAAAAATAAAILTPVGWALAGAAALGAIGYGAYKLARHLNSKAIKNALQDTLHNLQGKTDTDKISGLALGKDQQKNITKVAEKYLKSLATQGALGSPPKTMADITVGELRDYASKKYLARDTGVATEALYNRFKEEVSAKFPGGAPTEAQMKDY